MKSQGFPSFGAAGLFGKAWPETNKDRIFNLLRSAKESFGGQQDTEKEKEEKY